MPRIFHRIFVPIFLLGILLSNCLDTQSSQDSDRSSYSDWYAYGGDAGGTRYAQLDQVNRINGQRLERVWTYRTGELGQGSPVKEKLTFEATPILFDSTLYFSTAFAKVIALDPETGEECWVYDPKVDRTKRYSEVTSRGVSVWHDYDVEGNNSRAGRIFIGTLDARLIAIDAATGTPCQDFGDDGQVDLTEGLDVKSRIDYQVTSPPAVINDLVVVGSSIGDNWHADTGHGIVRAFDARTGVLLWAWNPLRSDEEYTGPVGGANAWSIISADPERNLVFVPTSSPSPDFYGGLRPGDNRYANSVVALRASTGAVVWHFQTVHHDLWDYDIAAQPALDTITHDGQRIPAVAQATKMGSLFLLHRETGQPVFPVEERPVPQTDVPGERTWETQPFSTLPLLMPQGPLTSADAWGLTDTEREENRELMGKHRSDGIFTPPSLEGTIMYPGNAAGTNWGSVAFDPERQLLVA
ncbi:MAG: PQQ-binding-like beta-propeller repeat protein, partial [Gemmatimonadota bacterium]|nr:PQQ-binding-like beta-propeller repeat protein [Gemmatimonadota bacterium]